jgi:uncharacterized protein (DUF1697 family)
MADRRGGGATTFVVLLRGINVGGHRKVPMAALRGLCQDQGFGAVQSHIQSGNLVFTATGDPTAALEAAVEKHFGFAVEIVVRTARQWAAYVAGNPFQEQAAAEPNHVMLVLAKAAPGPDHLEKLRRRASANERAELVGDAIWLYFGDGAARSKMFPATADGATARNWRTVLKLAEMAGA